MMKKYYLMLIALFFSACVSNTQVPVGDAIRTQSLNQCAKTVYIDTSDYKYLACSSVIKDKNGRKVVNIELNNLTKSTRYYKIKITWKDADGMVSGDTKERLTTEYIGINGKDSKSIFFVAPSADSVDFKILVTKIKSIPKIALYDKKSSTVRDNDFALAADELVKSMHIKKIRSEDFLNCGSMKCKIFVEKIKNRTLTDFPVKIIKDELITAIQEYELADYTDAISGDGSSSAAYGINKILEGNEDFDQNMIVQSGQLQGPTHALYGTIVENINIASKEKSYYLDIKINNLRTGTVEWQKQVKMLGKKL